MLFDCIWKSRKFEITTKKKKQSKCELTALKHITSVATYERIKTGFIMWVHTEDTPLRPSQNMPTNGPADYNTILIYSQAQR